MISGVLLKYIILFILFFLPFSNFVAQDSHYWSNQYGTTGGLLVGNVVAGVNDLSATYYNPGALVIAKDTVVLESTAAFEMIFLKAEHNLRTKINLQQTSFRPSPGMFAIKLPLLSLKRHQLAISFLTKTDFDFDISGNSIDNYSDTLETFNSQEIKINTHLKDIWFGFTWSYLLGENLGIGITNYAAIRTQNGRVQLFDGQSTDINLNNSLTFMEYHYYNVRFLWKFGLAWNTNQWSFGLSVTTPSLNLFGKGNAAMTSTMSKNNNSASYPQLLISNSQDGLSTKFNSPLSIAFGTKYSFDHTAIYFSMEWFSHAHPFNIMQPKDFIGQSDGKIYSYPSMYSTKSLLNFGMGIKHIFSKKFVFFGGFATDNSSYLDKSNNSFIQSTWDIFHITAGGKFEYGNLNITMGFGYSFSMNYFRKKLQLSGTSQTLNSDSINYKKLKALFGLVYQF